eukprot:2637159-Pyramimonas_sp.AAC.1
MLNANPALFHHEVGQFFVQFHLCEKRFLEPENWGGRCVPGVQRIVQPCQSATNPRGRTARGNPGRKEVESGAGGRDAKNGNIAAGTGKELRAEREAKTGAEIKVESALGAVGRIRMERRTGRTVLGRRRIGTRRTRNAESAETEARKMMTSAGKREVGPRMYRATGGKVRKKTGKMR